MPSPASPGENAGLGVVFGRSPDKSPLLFAASGGLPWDLRSFGQVCRGTSHMWPSGPTGPKGSFQRSSGNRRRFISGHAEVHPRLILFLLPVSPPFGVSCGLKQNG